MYSGRAGLRRAIEIMEEMRMAALQWVEATDEWPPVDRVGLYLHMYPHSSVHSLHLHIVDMDWLGPSWQAMQHKNLPLEEEIHVMRVELAGQELAQGPTAAQTLEGSNPHLLGS